MRVTRVLLCAERRDDWLLTSAFLPHDGLMPYEVEWAGSYQETERALGKSDHDVYLVDAALGRGRGLALAIAMARRCDKPILVLAARTRPAEEQRALWQGVAGVLVRSEITPYLLESAIRHALVRARRPQASTPKGAVDTAVLEARLEQAVARARRGIGGVALLRIGVEWMSETGEELTSAIELPWSGALERVRDCFRDIDTLARVDDGFLILVEDADARLSAARFAHVVLGELRQPMAGRGGTFRAAASIGVGVFPDDGTSAGSLMSYVSRAREVAMASGPGALQFSSLQLDNALARRVYLERCLESALDRGDFHLVYQPQLDSFTGELVGAEALLRWRHPDLGVIPPVEFIPILESSGLIAGVGAWVLQQGVAQARRWLDGGIEVPVSVNVSAKQFDQGTLERDVELALESACLPPRLLGIELTESLMLDATDNVLTTLGAIRNRGVHVAVDDFGTGYASLRYVKRFPMDVIKIDREFVRGLPLDNANAAITNAIVALAHSLDLMVVAEGVETDAEEEFLRSLQCNRVQGYLHSAPLDPEAFTNWYLGRRAG